MDISQFILFKKLSVYTLRVKVFLVDVVVVVAVIVVVVVVVVVTAAVFCSCILLNYIFSFKLIKYNIRVYDDKMYKFIKCTKSC